MLPVWYTTDFRLHPRGRRDLCRYGLLHSEWW